MSRDPLSRISFSMQPPAQAALRSAPRALLLTALCLGSCGKEEPGFQLTPLAQEDNSRPSSPEDARPLSMWPGDSKTQNPGPSPQPGSASDELGQPTPLPQMPPDSTTTPVDSTPVAGQPDGSEPAQPFPSPTPSPSPAPLPEPSPVLDIMLRQSRSSADYTSCAWLLIQASSLQGSGASLTSTGETHFLGCTRGRHWPDKGTVIQLLPSTCLSFALRIMTFVSARDADGIKQDGSGFARQPTGAYWSRQLDDRAAPADIERFALRTSAPRKPSHLTIGYEDFRGSYNNSDRDHNDLVIILAAPQRGIDLRIPHLFDNCGSL